MNLERRALAATAAVTAAATGLLSPGVTLGHGDAPLAPSLPGVLASWNLDPLTVALLLAGGVAYAWTVRSVDRAHPASPVPRRRHAWFAVALASLALALLSPIERYAESLFSVHMLQHMLLEFIAAPALLLAAPVTLALRAASTAVRRGLLGILNSRVVHVVSFPLIGWVVFAAVNWFWHFSPLYDRALDSPPLHYLEHAAFLLAAVAFWAPVVALDPIRWRLSHPVRLLYLFVAMPQNSFLGLAIFTTGRVLFPHYVSVQRAWGPSPLDDQHLAGALMWVGGDVALLIAMAAVVAGWMRHEERRTARMDARLDRLTDAPIDARR